MFSKLHYVKFEPLKNLMPILKSFKENKRIQNILFGIANQVLNQLSFLALLPYLTNTVGFEKFGVCMTAITVVNFFVVAMEFGFFYTCTKELQTSENKFEVIRETFVRVFNFKFVILVISMVLIYFIVWFKEDYIYHQHLFLYTALNLFSSLLFPSWLYMGLEKQYMITVYNLISKFILVFGTLVFVLTPNDYFYFNLFFSLGNVLSSLILFPFILSKYKIRLSIVDIDSLKNEWQKGSSYLSNNLIYFVYSNVGTIVLGYTATFEAVGYYSIAEKVLGAFRQLLNLISQVYYPYFCGLMPVNEKLKLLQVRAKYILSIVSILIFLVLYVASDFIVFLLGAKNDGADIASNCLKICSMIPGILFFNSYLFNYVAYEERNNDFSRSFIWVLVGNIALTILFSSVNGAIGVCFSLAITEAVIFLVLNRLVKRGPYFKWS